MLAAAVVVASVNWTVLPAARAGTTSLPPLPGDRTGLWVPPHTPLPEGRQVAGRLRAGPLGSRAGQRAAARPYRAPAVTLPAAGSTDFRLTPAAATPVPATPAAAARVSPAAVTQAPRVPAVQVAHSPIWIAPASGGDSPVNLRVRFAGPAAARKAGFRSGLLLGISPLAGSAALGQVQVQVDVSALAGEYGGDYAQRLRLVELPACALDTPGLRACQREVPVAGSLDPASGRLRATVSLPPPGASPGAAPAGANAAVGTSAAPAAASTVVLAAISSTAGSAGTYAATSIKPSDAWSAGGSTGDFAYQYPIAMPPTLGGQAPRVALSYSSASVDGLTTSTNAQASWAGDGWDYTPGFVERSYQPCSQDGISGSGDTCWALGGHEMSLSMAGMSGQLVYDDATQTWHLSSDSGAKVQLLTGASNGAYNGEYLEITSQDGVRYFFGAGRLPGAVGGTGGDPATNSVLTEPVYCPSSGDCDGASTGTGAFTPNMAYRWNLDYVVDPHGNATVYSYTPETNYYARGSSHALTGYDRAGHLTKIEYGWRTSDVASGASPAARVQFSTGPRCVDNTSSACASLTSATAPNWPDVPFDEVCGSTGSCLNGSMSYFSEVRLESIQTQVNEGTPAAPSWMTADSYALTQSLPDPGDGTSPALRLDSIQHTGDDQSAGVTGGAISEPVVGFGYQALPNRVPGAKIYPAYNRFRLSTISTETGGQIDINYTSSPNAQVPACDQAAGATVLPTPSNDNLLCYQEYWTPPGGSMIADWFEKYVASSVDQHDPTGGSADQVTQYQYPGTPAWHRNDSPLTDSAQRSWDQFRGFGQVITTVGQGSDPVTESETTYLRGMDGDYTAQSGGPQRSVTVTDARGDPAVVDAPQYAGFALEQQTFTRDGGPWRSDEVSRPWSAQTAAHAETAQPGLPPENAYFVNTAEKIERGVKADGSVRTTQTFSTYSASTGLLQQVDTEGDQAPSILATADSQETCTTNSYATPPSGNPMMLDYPARVTTVAVTTAGPLNGAACPAPASGTVQSDTRTYYDGQASPGAIGSAGDVTRIEDENGWSGSTENWAPTQQGGSYDPYGRQTGATSALGDATTTTMTPGTGVLPASVAVKDVTMGGWTTTTTLDRARQLATKTVDINGNTATEQYDALGRVRNVWAPGRSSAKTPDVKYTYSPTGAAGPTWTGSQTLRDDGTYAAAYTIYDGFMQPLQTQSLAVDSSGGSLVTDYRYDSHGWLTRQAGPYFEPNYPTSAVFTATQEAQIPSETVKTYDGMGDLTASEFLAYGSPQWQTTKAYPGVDRADVTPPTGTASSPTGASATSTFTDALGRTTATWKYTTLTATGNAADANVTGYAQRYVPGGTQTTVTDAAGHQWANVTDTHGNLVSSTDPDAGTAKALYATPAAAIAGDVTTATDARGDAVSYTYDQLGRKLTETAGTTPGSGTPLASWSYDSAAGGKDQLASSTSYAGGAPYTESVTGYNALYQSLGQSVTIPTTSQGLPAGEAKLAGTYTTSNTYTTNTSLLASTSYGADGGLPAETVSNTYTQNGILDNVASDTTGATYLAAVSVDQWGRTTRYTVGNTPDQVVATSYPDLSTGRITRQVLDKQTAAAHVNDITTRWNSAGLITAVSDTQDGTATDLQCYQYDTQGQLTQAWTDTAGTTQQPSPSVPGVGGCTTAAPAAATIGGPAPYWQAYGYDQSGDRTKQTDYIVTGGTVSQATQAYSYPTATGTTGQPHTLSQTTNTPASGAPTTDSYSYDAAGNTKTRVLGDGSSNQTFSYDQQGRTAGVTDSVTGTAASYLYDASGGLLLQRDTTKQADTVTLYLGGEQLSLNVGSNTVSGLRYYSTGGGPAVVRSSAGTVSYEAGDGQGTMSVELDATTLAQARRYYTPYGQARGAVPGWIDNRGFVGQPQDTATTLDLLGARQYDPGSGRFLQRDPLVESGDPNQQGGYSYAGDDPVNGADPTGTMMACPSLDGTSCAGHGGGGGTGGGSGGGGTGGGGGGGGTGGGGGGGGGGGTGRPTGGGGGGGTRTGTASTSDSAPKYVISFTDPEACATLLCYQQETQGAQDIANQIQQQQQAAEQQAEACATQLCHDQIMSGLADGAYNVVAAGPDLVTSNGHSITTATPAAVMKVSATPAPRPPARGGCHGFWGCAVKVVAKVTGIQDAIDCIKHPTVSGCAQAAIRLTATAFTIASLGTGAEADAGVNAALDGGGALATDGEADVAAQAYQPAGAAALKSQVAGSEQRVSGLTKAVVCTVCALRAVTGTGEAIVPQSGESLYSTIAVADATTPLDPLEEAPEIRPESIPGSPFFP